MENNKITVEVIVNAPVEKVWDSFTKPESIKNWAFASDDWTVGDVTNDLKVAGRFLTNMHAKDNSTGFDFTGTYTEVEPMKKIAYTMDGDDQRKVETTFESMEGGTKVTQTFDMEHENPREMQQGGWQGILNNFKKFVEGN